MTDPVCKHPVREFGPPRRVSTSMSYLPWECKHCNMIGMLRLPSEGILGSRVGERLRATLAGNEIAGQITEEQWSASVFDAFFGSVEHEHGPNRHIDYRISYTAICQQLERLVPAAIAEIRDRVRIEFNERAYGQFETKIAALRGEVESLTKQRDALESVIARRRSKVARKLGTYKLGALPVLATSEGVAKDRFIVYALVDSREPERIRYVGKSSKPELRFINHVTAGHPKVRDWYESVRAAGAHVIMQMLDQYATAAEMDVAESGWILALRAQGFCDCNTAIPKGRQPEADT